MPLSEDEQRQLEQIERDLAQEDPPFAGQLDGGRRRVTVAAVILAVGMILMPVGVGLIPSAAMFGAIIGVAAMLAIIAALAVYLQS
jgi:hypothetical protein